jgi:hypothetical protein
MKVNTNELSQAMNYYAAPNSSMIWAIENALCGEEKIDLPRETFPDIKGKLRIEKDIYGKVMLYDVQMHVIEEYKSLDELTGNELLRVCSEIYNFNH